MYSPDSHRPLRFDATPGHDYTGDYPHSLSTGAGTGRTNVTAIAALVCAVLFAPAGIVLGHVARRQVTRTGGPGGTVATAALFIGYVLVAIPVVIYLTVALVLIGSAAADGHDRHRSGSAVTTTP